MADKPVHGMGHYIIYGAIFCGMASIFLGQKFIPGVEASSDKTMMVIVIGAIVGAVAGGVIGKAKLNKPEA